MSRRFYDTEAAVEIVKDIKKGEYSNSSEVYGLLKQIISDLPDTSVAREAQQLLDELF